jgi:ABC-type Fe3+-hydroxamate transport system substrate-binding protein
MDGTVPHRVVSLVPSLTETLFDLGAGDRVVGVTDWCGPALPAGARPESVGGVQDPDLQALRRLKPDLVVASREENRREDVQALTEAGIPVLVVHPTDPATAAEAVDAIGRAVGLRRRAREIAGDILDAVDKLAADPVPPLRAVVPIWRDPWITVGPGSYGHAALAAAGFDVVGAAGEGPYPPLELDRAQGAQLVLLLDEPFDFHGAAGDDLVARLTGSDGRSPRALRVDGRWVAWYGSRSGRRLHRLARLRRTRS